MREILKRERMKQKLTQQELADKAGISRVHYTQIENASNKKNPSLEVALKIKTALGYNSDDLFLYFDISTACNKNAGSIRKKLIEARGSKSQADVAADTGFSQKYISYLELGQKTPSLKSAIKIASYYKRDIEELFSDVFQPYEIHRARYEKPIARTSAARYQICDISSENLIAELKKRGYKVFKEV